MDWAQTQAKKLADAENALRKDRDRQSHVTEVIRTEGPRLFGLLCTHLQNNANQFNAELNESRLRCEISAQLITVSFHRETDITLTLELKGTFIAARLREVTSYNAQNARTWEMRFRVDQDDRISIDSTGDLDKLSQALLDRVVVGVFALRD